MRYAKWLFVFFAVALCAATVVVPIADISGTGTAVQVSSTQGAVALWVQFVAPSTNSSVVRVGDVTVSGTTGVPVAPGGGYFLPAINYTSGPPTKYDLSTLYVIVQSGDKLSVEYGK